MRAISIRQPWASLIALGEKTVECRSWTTRFRGRLLICASGRDVDADGLLLPAGYAVATVDLVDIRPFATADLDAACLGQMPDGPRFSWALRGAQEIEPFRVKGRLGLYEVDATPTPLRGASDGWTHIDAIMRHRRAVA